MMKPVTVAALLSLCLLAGCATVFAGGPDEVPINTNPPGAYVYVNGQMVGQTPTVVRLDRHADSADIRIYYPGFQPIQLFRYKSFNMWTLGNFFLAIWPVVIDIVTGDWQCYDDAPVLVGLTPGNGPPPYGLQPTMGGQPQQGYPQQPQGSPQPPQGYPQAPAPYPGQQPQQPAPAPR
jgi:hypothetical protein